MTNNNLEICADCYDCENYNLNNDCKGAKEKCLEFIKGKSFEEWWNELDDIEREEYNRVVAEMESEAQNGLKRLYQ